MIDFIASHYGSIIWVLLTLGILTWEIVGVFSKRVRTITGMFWILIGYRPETRWEFSWWRFGWFVAWLVGGIVLTSHLFLGIP